MRLNTHRTSKQGCEHVISHKASCVGCEFSCQILEKLHGNGYDSNNKVYKDVTKLRLSREDHWIKKLHTLYPYGLNEKASNKICDSECTNIGICRLFSPLSLYVDRSVRSRIRIEQDINNIADFFDRICHFSKVNLIILVNSQVASSNSLRNYATC